MALVVVDGRYGSVSNGVIPSSIGRTTTNSSSNGNPASANVGVTIGQMQDTLT